MKLYVRDLHCSTYLDDNHLLLQACKDIKNLIIKTTWQYTVDDFNLLVGFDPEVWHITHKGESSWGQKVGSIEMREKGAYLLPQSRKFKNTEGNCALIIYDIFIVNLC